MHWWVSVEMGTERNIGFRSDVEPKYSSISPGTVTVSAGDTTVISASGALLIEQHPGDKGEGCCCCQANSGEGGVISQAYNVVEAWDDAQGTESSVGVAIRELEKALEELA
jgi:hypothetical protein